MQLDGIWRKTGRLKTTDNSCIWLISCSQVRLSFTLFLSYERAGMLVKSKTTEVFSGDIFLSKWRKIVT